MDVILNNASDTELISSPEKLRADHSNGVPDPTAKNEKKTKRRAIAATVLGSTAFAITAIKVLLFPILSIAALVFDVAVFLFLMMGGALMLAMITIVMPFLPLIIILLVFVLAIAIVVLELIPITLGIIATVLAASAQKSARKGGVKSPKCKKLTMSAKISSLCGLILSILGEPVALIPIFILCLPFLLLIVIAVVYLFQLLGLAIA